jgi:hypothetical protein
MFLVGNREEMKRKINLDADFPRFFDQQPAGFGTSFAAQSFLWNRHEKTEKKLSRRDKQKKIAPDWRRSSLIISAATTNYQQQVGSGIRIKERPIVLPCIRILPFFFPFIPSSSSE